MEPCLVRRPRCLPGFSGGCPTPKLPLLLLLNKLKPSFVTLIFVVRLHVLLPIFFSFFFSLEKKTLVILRSLDKARIFLSSYLIFNTTITWITVLFSRIFWVLAFNLCKVWIFMPLGWRMFFFSVRCGLGDSSLYKFPQSLVWTSFYITFYFI